MRNRELQREQDSEAENALTAALHINSSKLQTQSYKRTISEINEWMNN